MTHDRLVSLNRILGDALGYIPPGYPNTGESAFQFRKSSELFFPFRAGTEANETPSGLVLFGKAWRMEQQYPGDEHWVLCRWLQPGWVPPDLDTGAFEDVGETKVVSPSEFARLRPNAPWQPLGSWIGLMPLRPGKEPDEEWTAWAASVLKDQMTRSMRDTMNYLMDRQLKIKADYAEAVAMTVRDLWVNHVPGARGGSYLAFNESAAAE